MKRYITVAIGLFVVNSFFSTSNNLQIIGTNSYGQSQQMPFRPQPTEEEETEEIVEEDENEPVIEENNNNSGTNTEEESSFTSEDKDGYQIRYIIIPDHINITDSDEFKITSFNEGGNVYTESILAENAGNESNLILLEDDVDNSVGDGYKVVKASFPAESNEESKFAIGYKLNETSNSFDYVYLLEDDPLESTMQNLIEDDPFGLIEPNNYSNFNDFPGIDTDSNTRYLAVPIKEGSLNYETSMSTEKKVTFTIKPDGSIVPDEEFYLEAKVLSAEFSSNVDIYAELFVKKPDNNNWTSINKWDNDIQTNDSNNSPIPDYNSSGIRSFPADTEIGIQTWYSWDSSLKKTSWNKTHVSQGSNDSSYYIEVHKKGDEIYNIGKEGYGGQSSISSVLSGYIVKNEQDGKFYFDGPNVGDLDIIILTEHYTNSANSSAFDLQDTVILITLKSSATTSTTTYNYTIVKDEGTSSKFDINMKSGSSDTTKQRISDIEMKIINNSRDKNFDIKNTKE